MNTDTINQRDIPTIAKQLRKRVNTLLLVYFLLIFGTIIFFLAVLAGAIFGAIFMISEEYFNFKIAALLLGFVIMAGVCVKVVLNPLLRMFDRREQVGTEIKRSEYPELFSVIDEIVKAAGCKFPKHVFIYNECNAFVNCRSLWGHLFNVRKNLTIGLPLLYTLNKTELKAILSHEFGHFTQKSIAINSIANLSEFICAAIARSLEQIEKADADSYEAKAQWFAELATKIMAKQYHNVAPLNGILSRAQEFDADLFSYSIAGTEATISALSKVSYFSERWDSLISILYKYVEEERRPVDIYDSVKLFNKIGNSQGVQVDTGVVLTDPLDRIGLNVQLGDNTATHPEMTDRCHAIRSQEKIETKWDMTPAMEYFPEETVRKQFNQIPDELAKIKFPYSTIIFFKKNVTNEELENIAKARYNNFLLYFYNNGLFASPKAWVEENEEHPEYESSPFTASEYRRLQIFERDRQDLHMLEQIVDENSYKRTFSYFGKKYTGTNVPIQEHRELTERSYAAAVEVARHCNYWLTKKTKDTSLAPYFNLMCASLATLSDLVGIQNHIETVDSIYHANDTSTKAMEYVRSIDKEYRRCIAYMLETLENNPSRFTLIADWMNVKDEVIENVTGYFHNALGDNLKPMITSYQQIYGILNDFRQEAWQKIVYELIIPSKLNKVTEEQEETASQGEA